jgi:hypothetical protein
VSKPQIPRVPVDTRGWDLALKLPLTSVNNALAENPGLVLSTFLLNEDRGLIPFRLRGVFGAWSVIGGSGQNIILALPINEGTLTVAETGSTIIPAGNYDLAGTRVELVVRLDFSPRFGNQEGMCLVFSFDDTGDARLAGSLVHATGTARLTTTHRAMIGPLVSEAMAKILSANADKVCFVFSQIAPKTALTDGFQELAYMVAGTPSGEHNLCIFCGSASLHSQPGEISDLPFCPDGTFVAALSQQIVIEKMFKPAIVRSLWEAQFPLKLPFGRDVIGSLPVPIEMRGRHYDLDATNFKSTVRRRMI